MKKTISLVIITLLFVVLGCSLDKLTGSKDEVPTPVPDSSSATDKGDGDKTVAGDSMPTNTDSSSDPVVEVSSDKFNKIELGMSYEQVKEIVGSAGVEASSSKIGENETKSIRWKGDKFALISTSFKNDKLTMKSQSNLSDRNGIDEISLAKYDKADIGMTYEQLKELFGSDGELTRISQLNDVEFKTYIWKGAKSERIYTSYRANKLANKSQSGLN